MTRRDDTPLSGDVLVKEVCRRIRVARSYWDAHNNAACRRERPRTLQHFDPGAEAEDSPGSESLAALSE